MTLNPAPDPVDVPSAEELRQRAAAWERAAAILDAEGLVLVELLWPEDRPRESDEAER